MAVAIIASMKIKGLILLADGFEETEAITTHDILNRSGGIEPAFVSISDSHEVTTSMGLKVHLDLLLKDVPSFAEYSFIVLPGGKVGVENLKNSPLVIDLVKSFIKEKKDVFAICAAPSILGELGYLDKKNYTCFPGFQKGKGNWIDAGVVQDGNLITARSMAFTIGFAEKIAEFYLGHEVLSKIKIGSEGRVS